MTTCIGILGVGQLAEYLVRGWHAAPVRFLLSPRSHDRAEALVRRHDAEIAPTNQAVLDGADHILVCLPARDGPDILRGLEFRRDHSVLSCMAGTGPALLRELVAPAHAVAAMMPGFSNAFGAGPTVICPPDADWQHLLEPLGPVLPVADEARFAAAAVMGALSGASVHWMRDLIRWFQGQGLDPTLSRELVAALIRGNAEALLRSPDPLDDIAAGVTTPGGITEALLAHLDGAGAMAAWGSGMDRIRDRLADGARPVTDRNPK